MRSVRFEEALDKAIVTAATREGVTVSEFIRRAVSARVDIVTAGPSNVELLADIIGSAPSTAPHDDASRASESFTDYVVAKHRRHSQRA